MELLEKLTQTPGVPGRESRIRDLILQEIEGLFDEVSIDPMGSVIAVRKPTAPDAGDADSGVPTRVMVAAHMDQIGFLVRHVGDDGFLRVQNVGGFDTRNLFRAARFGGHFRGRPARGDEPRRQARAHRFG